ncbi:MAG: class A beta-lactamase-related serine hydrolase [Oscillospiraceae bacterium]|nr:class A beta-lactamase-related serine hydrolase [Oscillospiraceae bacterium]
MNKLELTPVTKKDEIHDNPKTDISSIHNKNDRFDEEGITINHSEYTVSETKQNKLTEILNKYKFDAGIYLIDLDTKMSLGYNADMKFSTASTVKAGYALYCFNQIAVGHAKFTDLMTFREKHLITGSGDTQNSEFGTVFTIRALLYRMLYNSDNVAYYMLLDFFGFDGYNAMMKQIGCEHEISNADKWGNYSPHELGLIWEAIYNFKDTCDEGKLLWDYLTNNLYNELKDTLKYDVIAHKSGWNPVGYHDAGVVFGVRDYIAVIMTRAGKNLCLYELIRWVDEVVIEYDDWLV